MSLNATLGICPALTKSECGPIFNATMDMVDYTCGCVPDGQAFIVFAVMLAIVGVILLFNMGIE